MGAQALPGQFDVVTSAKVWLIELNVAAERQLTVAKPILPFSQRLKFTTVIFTGRRYHTDFYIPKQ